MDEIYGVDEESMIPKGLLDMQWEKNPFKEDETTSDRTEFSNSNAINYNVPCYIAVVPPEHSSNIGERYPCNLGQNNENHLYSPTSQQMMSYYGGTPQTGEYFVQYQRRALNVMQQQKHFHDMEYCWWNQVRLNQSVDFNSGAEMRTSNNLRSNNTLINDKTYTPIQPFVTNRYPFEYQQRMSGLNSHTSIGNDVFQSPSLIQNIFNKTGQGCQAASRAERASQTDHVIFQVHTPAEILSNSHDEPTTILCDTKDCNIPDDDKSELNSEDNIIISACCKSTIESYIKQDNFCNAAFYGCLQLEQLLTNINTKLLYGIDLTQFCTTLKSDLTKSKPLVKSNAAAREMIIAFLQVCYSWVSLNALKTYKRNKTHAQFQFEALNNCINKWENNSKTLIQKIIGAIQCIPLDETYNETPVIKILKNNLNKTKNLEQEHISCHSKKRYNENEPDFLNYNWRKTNQTSPKETDRPDRIECTMCHLIPQTQKSYNESNLVCDNFMKNLKKTQEKANNKVGNSQRYTCQKSKQSTSPRGRFTVTEPQSYCKENTSRNDSLDKLYNDGQKKTKIPLLTQKDNFQTKSDFSNFTKFTNYQKPFDENRYPYVHYSDKCYERHHSFERSFMNNLEGTNCLENENYSKCNAPLNISSVLKKETDIDIERGENTVTGEKGKGKRYSQQSKKKGNFSIQNVEGFGARPGEINSFIISKLYRILINVDATNLEKNISEKLVANDVSKLQKSLLDPISGIAEQLIKNTYRTVDEIVSNLLSLFYQAKLDNKGDMLLLTMANQLETKLMNTIYIDIGLP